MGILDSVLDKSKHGELPAENVTIYTDISDVPVDEFPDDDKDNSILAPDGNPAKEDDARLLESATSGAVRIVPFVRLLKQGMVGKDVVAVKRSLARAGFGKLGPQTRLFGPFMKRNLKSFQKKHGLVQDGVYGLATHKKLAPYFDDYSLWLLHQTHIKVAPTKRDVIVATAILGYNKSYLIHYTQGPSRMYGVKHHVMPPSVPPYEDCSSFATWCYWVAKAADPNGLGYNGYGFTGTLASHGRSTTVAAAQRGDLILYGRGYPYSHVVVYIGNGKAISHGSERGPSLVNVYYRSDLRSVRSYL